MYGKYLVLFAILFTGWFLRKIDFIDDKMNHSMNKLIVYFAYPCLIVHNIGTLEMSSAIVGEFLLTFLLSLICLYLYGAFAKGYAKFRHFPPKDSGVAEFSMMAPNDGFMGFPVALIFFGETGLLMMLAHNAAMNFVMFTYGVTLLKRNGEGNKTFSIRTVSKAVCRVLVNPNILALFVGFAISLAPFEIPGPVDEYLLYIGNVSTPMAMIFIGSTLSRCSFKEIIKDRISIESSVVKLIWLPVLTFVAVYFLPVSGLIKCILVLGTSFPAAATVSMLAEQEGLDARVASKVLFLSTIASVITIPLIIKALLYLSM